MTHQPPPYTPKTLAKRWGCSVSHVYDLIHRGELDHFRLGAKLYRIPVDAVERFECGWQNTEANSAPSGTRTGDAFAVRLARMT
ncbi:MAG: DNA-binding protein [Alphaproteobacteria bacterium]|nr:MAG: DNA-binding protein [Alphaproteobacteria bacterium]